jgi:hypothetical protein
MSGNRVMQPGAVEQSAYREIFALASFGVPIEEIAEMLTEEGYRNRRGWRWSTQRVAFILKHGNPTSQQKAG